jgi:hypothetical protein
MPDEFDIIFELVLGFFVETIVVLVILIRLDQPRDRTEPTDDRHGRDQSTLARLHLRSSHHKANNHVQNETVTRGEVPRELSPQEIAEIKSIGESE